jgi:hypothetical protein
LPSALGILGISGIYHSSFGILHSAFPLPARLTPRGKKADFLELSGKLWQSTL